MRIRGTIIVEGIKLHVDIEAPPHERELLVTNVHPSRIVIPRERWKIEYLGLSDKVVSKLRALGFKTLDNLLDSEWSLDPIGMHRIPADARQEVEQALEDFKEAALIFEMPREDRPGDDAAEAKRQTIASENRTSSGPAAHQNGSAKLDDTISVIGLPKPVEDAICQRHRVALIRELAALTEEDLIMTPHVDEKALRRIRDALKERGLYL